MINLVFCDTQEDLHRLTEPGGGRRTGVEMYEIAIDETIAERAGTGSDRYPRS